MTRPRRMLLSLAAMAVMLSVGACAPKLQTLGQQPATPAWIKEGFRQDDGIVLPVRQFLPRGKPKAVILALHGFNDYSQAFARPAPFLTNRGIAVVAYDQRGFGDTDQRGIWPGEDRLVADMRTALDLVRAHFPGTPVFLLGESMGGAVILAANGTFGHNPPDGMILVAPAVYGRDQIGPVGSGLLWLTAHTLPWWEVTGEGIKVHPTDNRDVLRELWRDPKVIKKTRIDAVYGLVNLMDRARESGRALHGPVLIQYGMNEDIVAPDAVRSFVGRFPSSPCGQCPRVALYHHGYHMLLRDLAADKPLTDIVTFLLDPTQSLPSGAEDAAQLWLNPPADPPQAAR